MSRLFLLAGVLLLTLVPASNGDGYCRNRSTTYYAPTYATYTPAYKAPAYVAPTYDYTPVYQTYLKTQLYPTTPDYYASTNDYYRDKVLLDAISGKVQDLLKKDRAEAEQKALKDELEALRRQLLYMQSSGQQPVPQAQPQQQPQAQPEQAPQQQRMPRATGALPAVPEGLQAVVTTSCIRCHGATAQTAGGGIDLQNLAAVPRETRLAAKAAVDDGTMPKGGKPLDDRAAALFHTYATGRSGTLAAK